MKVWEIIIHEDWDYDSEEFDADISLVVLETEVSRGLSVRIVCLPAASQAEVSGTGSVVGWGVSRRSDANGDPHDSTPNELELPAVPQSQCFEADRNFIIASSNRTFCAGYVNQDKAACKGDSGGGFFLFDRSTKSFNLAGIVSASLIDPKLGPCRTDTYSIFTDVGKFVGWIGEKMEKTKEIKWKEIEFECREIE